MYQLKNISLVCAGLAVVGCKNDAQTSEDKELVSGIYTENMDTTVDPGDNFTAYVNGGWVKKTEIPADKSSYGTMTIVREEAEENVKKIIEEAASGEFEKGSDEQKLGDFYKSYMDLETRNSAGITPMQEEFSKIEEISNYEDLTRYFAYANKMGIDVPLGFYISPDYKDPQNYVVYAAQWGLGLPDREYYLKEDDRSKEIRQKYQEHISRMFQLAGLENGEKAASTILKLETALAEKQMPKEQRRNRVANYNMMTVDTLNTLMPRFNWNTYLEAAGLEDQDKLVVMMLDYTKSLDQLVRRTNLATWKTYLKWSALNSAAPYLSEEIDQEHFEFYNKELRGTPEQRPLWRRGVSVVNRNLGELVGKVYVQKHFPPEAKERMEELVENLLKAYEASIKELDWMSEDTKKEALDKLSKFDPKIGYPEEWKTYDIEVAADDLMGNIMRTNAMEYQRNVDKLGKPVDRKEWGMTPQTVNAYYNPSKNEIVFPAAILQPPFFNLNADDAVNYGAIGAVIGHEIGHGFDDSGSTFDGDGTMRNWWTETDREEFKKRTDALVAQYNGFEVLPELNVNGEFTLGENIGDLGGLSIALKAYKMSLDGKEGPVLDGFTGEQRVFMGWAQGWMGKSRDEALRVQVSTDPHSPRDFRVNGVVRNIPEFYTAFNVEKGDSLYLAPEERVKIW
ncbi:putative endopeptidase [Zeaxanthinibacter enoshimensis]|uniref:Putative endopeptidase n=2 Tax=Zeaxanthinibacter enoshimensis TaxID=392009 RepID=A0A4R6TIF9_9FLAO|nr:putative endopeptidase [Zeaxanthinibacter enoshimensis]